MDWNITKIRELLETYGHILLYCFIASILINPFLLLFTDREAGAHVVYDNKNFASYELIGGFLTDKETGYRVLSPEIVSARQQRATAIQWTGIAALLGWMSTSRRFNKGMKKLVHKW